MVKISLFDSPQPMYYAPRKPVFQVSSMADFILVITGITVVGIIFIVAMVLKIMYEKKNNKLPEHAAKPAQENAAVAPPLPTEIEEKAEGEEVEEGKEPEPEPIPEGFFSY